MVVSAPTTPLVILLVMGQPGICGLSGRAITPDWRRIHTRYDRCAHTFFSAICIAATVIFWINQ